jgi:hypothetical protein
MERARATWTDERLDDMSKSVDRVDADLRQLRAEMNGHFDALEGRLGARIDALNRSMLQVGGGIIVAVLATMASVIATGS